MNQLEFGKDVLFDVPTSPSVKGKLAEHCSVCGRVAKEKSNKEVKTSKGWMRVITLECNHIIFRNCDSYSPFESVVFDGDASCKHTWGKEKARTKCITCGAKRLYEYQVEGARRIERSNGRIGVFDEQGLGKTIEALVWMKFHPEAFPYAWVTKSGIKFQHAKEIVRILGKEYFPQVIMSGKDSFIPNMKGYLFSYDIFRRLNIDDIKALGIKSIILDECQAIKNPDSTRTALVRNIARECPFILPLSGTPWKNRGSEFFVALNMLDPKRFYSFKAFKEQWVDSYWENNKEKEGGIRNPEKFKEYVKDIVIRRERKDVMPELPLINRTQFLTQVPEHARKLYNEEVNKLTKMYNDAVIDGNEDSFQTNGKVWAQLMVMKQIVGLAKIDGTVELAKEFLEDTGRPLVIFLHHKKCGELVTEQMRVWCRENNLLEPLQLTSKLNTYQRQQLCDDFVEKGHKLLIASTLGSGEGLDGLQKVCNDLILMERQFNPANEEQVEGRFIRIGQEANNVNAIYIHGDNTIDSDLDAIVERKRLWFQASMNSGITPTWNEGSIVKELAMAIVNRNRKAA